MSKPLFVVFWFVWELATVTRCYFLWSLASPVSLPKHTTLIVGGRQSTVQNKGRSPFRIFFSLGCGLELDQLWHLRLVSGPVFHCHFSRLFSRVAKRFAMPILNALPSRYRCLLLFNKFPCSTPKASASGAELLCSTFPLSTKRVSL